MVSMRHEAMRSARNWSSSSGPGRSEVRLELEQVEGGAAVIHNYGHGSIGHTLAWGCAAEVVQHLGVDPRSGLTAEALPGRAAWRLGERVRSVLGATAYDAKIHISSRTRDVAKPTTVPSRSATQSVWRGAS